MQPFAQVDVVLEADEIWSFVAEKGKNIDLDGNEPAHTRSCLLLIGDRSEKTCQKLWKRISKAYQVCLGE